MKKIVYYEAVEKAEDREGSMLIENPQFKIEKMRWSRFATLDGAKKAVARCKKTRQTQYHYFRDEDGNLKDKISYYELHRLSYKIYKIVQTEEIVYEENNNDIKLKKADNSLQEEISL